MQSKNYIIHGDADGDTEFDFFAQLKNMLSHSEAEASENEDNCCLLTKEPLQHIHIVLACGHKFNYVPIYREVIAQKTVGLSSTGYYTSHSLRRNEIKCPYCRNVQDKLLPYLEFDGVKKMVNVNHPAKMSMPSQPCMYSTNVKSKKSASCKECAINCHNGTYVCKKHYELSTPESSSITTTTTTTTSSICGVILRYGKNKGIPCPNPPSCRVHSANKNNQTATV